MTNDEQTYSDDLHSALKRAGTVSLVSTDTSDIEIDYTITQEVDYLENLVVEVEIKGTGALDLRFEIEGVQFGNLYTTYID